MSLASSLGMIGRVAQVPNQNHVNEFEAYIAWLAEQGYTVEGHRNEAAKLMEGKVMELIGD